MCAMQTYKIGDCGPARGIVFYDKKDNKDGWRYMEAAPNNLQNAEWGLDGENLVGTNIKIGFGKQNTELIIKALDLRGESGTAVQLCKEYTLNGYNDWFLPSKNELLKLYKNLKENNLGNFTSDWFWYWSSSQENSDYAWLHRFSDGVQYACGKNFTGSVRAVRVF